MADRTLPVTAQGDEAVRTRPDAHPGYPDALPDGPYLCQAGDRISCGACCGLYNVRDLSRENLVRLLSSRTERFESTARDVDGIEGFKASVRAGEDPRRPFADFHHCPYIGLVGERRARVGCLLHPSAAGNRGVDYRGLSHYGGMACRTYFCPTYQKVGGVHRSLVIWAMADWYDFGLVITEWRMLNALFGALERILGRPLTGDDTVGGERSRTALRDLLGIKIHWPFRGPTAKAPAHHFFKNAAYTRPAIDYAGIGLPPSPHDTLFQELESHFSSRDRLAAAESLLTEALQRAARVLGTR